MANNDDTGRGVALHILNKYAYAMTKFKFAIAT